MTNDKQKRFIIHGITALVFVLFLLVLSVMNLFTPHRSFSDNENRPLASFPNASIQNIFLGSFDTEFENWFSDQFIFRDNWITTKARARKTMGAIENNGVYFGKNDRLIKQFLTYQEKTLNANIDYINEFTDEQGIKANVMIIPEASYGEKNDLPFGAYNINERDLIQTITDKMPNQNMIPVLDLLYQEKDAYFKTDHHWNEAGAKIGYSQICKTVLNKAPNTFTEVPVSDQFYGTMYSRSGAFWTKPDRIVQIKPEKDIEVHVTFEDGKEYDSIYFDNKLKEKDKYTYYLDGNHAYVNIKTNVDTKKKAVIVKDSYAHILMPYLMSEYSEIKLFDLRYYREEVSQHLDDKENTDFYIIYSTDTFTSDNSLVGLW